jgi:hypothetical protein
MKNETKKIVSEIDKEIRQHDWFDFHILKYDGYKLIVAGSIDLIYYHKLEIIFEDILFVSGFFQEWHTDTSTTAFQVLNNQKEMNEKYEIQQGYQLFVFKTENYNNDVIIVAKNISFNTDTVYYYDKADLKDNERIADFVKKNIL